MLISGEQIHSLNSIYIKYVQGQLNNMASKPVPPEHDCQNSLVYVSSKDQLKLALEKSAGIIIAQKKCLENISEVKLKIPIFETESISAAMALVNVLFDEKEKRWPRGLSDKADIHPTAKVGANVSIGSFAVIGENVTIGENTIISPHCVIEKNAKIGSNSKLHSFVFIGEQCFIGNHCEIHPHTTIGSDGFGYATDKNNINHKISQLGNVIIEDNVEIGASCAIDRATLASTIIRKGTKLDNLIHVAHNCDFGENGLFAASFATAGSTIIGKNFKCGGVVAVADHIKITDNVTIGGRSAITRNIDQPGAYVGYPIQPMTEGMKTLASILKLNDLRKEFQELKKMLSKKD